MQLRDININTNQIKQDIKEPIYDSIKEFPSPDVDMSEFDRVCEDVTGFADHEEFFNKKFDQLEKLHELYKSVSSISAASQSRLELNKNRTFENKNLLPGHRSASFSLTGLMLGDLDNLSLPSTVSDDMASMCSEPAWVSRPQVQTQCLDINRNSTSCTNSALDLVNICNVSNLDPSLSLHQLITNPGLNKTNFSSQINKEPAVPGAAAQDRSDSPILEGIDSDLAKYAKLKDLEKAYYKPKNENLLCDKNSDNNPPLGSLRHPDGSSNPDLGTLITDTCQNDITSTRVAHVSTLPERSPGTGRSSSGSDPETEAVSRQRGSGNSISRPLNQHLEPLPSSPATQHLNKTKTMEAVILGTGSNHPTAVADNGVVNAEQAKNVDLVMASKSVKDQKEKTPKIPRFSRLFGNVKKISRSPTQISKGTEEKTRSKVSKRQAKTSSQISLKDSGQLKTEKLIADKPTKTKYKFFEKREKCFPKSPLNVAKNVKGTLSSEQSSEKPKSTKVKNSPLLQKSDKKEKKSIKTRNQGVCAVSCLPSPYSFPSKVKTKKTVASETSGSGYDSGIESGGGIIVAGIRSSSLVKIRGKGADTMIIGSQANSLQLQRRSSRSHCKSSGYESIGLESLESESTSVDSCHATLNNVKEGEDNLGPSSVQILQYDENTVDRMDRHWRFEEIKRLKKKQQHLKGELFCAKSRINSDPGKWSYELHTEESGLEPTDPNFVEAFEKETVILDKRVQACKSHVVLSTCFVNTEDDREHKGQYGQYQGCTADCEAYNQDTSTGQL